MYYRMPYGFGPFPGPRQIPGSGVRDAEWSPKRTVAAITFDTDADALVKCLPPGFEIRIPARVAFEVQHLREVDWLAGRDYSTFGVKIPATYRSREGEVEGDFLAVLWENLADPIISGREELGYAKLWCDIHETSRTGTSRVFSASWLGHLFAEMTLTDLQPATATPPPRPALLHYKYLPRTGSPGYADAAYATMTPADNPMIVVESRLEGSGSMSFRRSSWEQLPTLFHIVNQLADIPLGPLRSTTLTFSHGGKDLSDQCILESA